MNITARFNQTLDIMKKLESRQAFNRILFFISLGIVAHTVTCCTQDKKLTPLNYTGIGGAILTTKRAFTLKRKEEKGQKLWHILQQKSTIKS